MIERVQKLKEAVEAAHSCEAVYVVSVPVCERFQGQTIWEGVVTEFTLHGHPKAKRCYAWSYEQGSETHYTTVLELPPITGPHSAVLIAVAEQARN